MNYQHEYCKSINPASYCQHSNDFNRHAICHGTTKACRWNCAGGTCVSNQLGKVTAPYTIQNNTCVQNPHIASSQFSGWATAEECKEHLPKNVDLHFACGPKGCVADENGKYASMDECKGECSKFTCDPTRGCQTDPTGQYSSMGECQKNCVNGHVCDSKYGWKSQYVSPSDNEADSSQCKLDFACQNRKCIGTGFSLHPTTKDECQKTCGLRYACNERGRCYVDANGQYTSMTDCQKNCYGNLVQSYPKHGNNCEPIQVMNPEGTDPRFLVPIIANGSNCSIYNPNGVVPVSNSTKTETLYCTEGDKGLTYCCPNKPCTSISPYYWGIDYGKHNIYKQYTGHKYSSNMYYIKDANHGICASSRDPPSGKQTFHTLAACEAALPYCWQPVVDDAGKGSACKTVQKHGLCPSQSFPTTSECLSKLCFQLKDNTCQPAVCMDKLTNNQFHTMKECSKKLCSSVNTITVNGQKAHQAYLFKNNDGNYSLVGYKKLSTSETLCAYILPTKDNIFVVDSSGKHLGYFTLVPQGASESETAPIVALAALGIGGGTALFTSIAVGIDLVLGEGEVGDALIVYGGDLSTLGAAVVGTIVAGLAVAIIVGVVELVEWAEEEEFYPIKIPGITLQKPLYVRESTKKEIENNIGLVHFKYPKEQYGKITFGDSSKEKTYFSAQLGMTVTDDGNLVLSSTQLVAVINMLGGNLCVGSVGDNPPQIHYNYPNSESMGPCTTGCQPYASLGTCPKPPHAMYTGFCTSGDTKSKYPVPYKNVCSNGASMKNLTKCDQTTIQNYSSVDSDIYRDYGPVLDWSCLG